MPWLPSTTAWYSLRWAVNSSSPRRAFWVAHCLKANCIQRNTSARYSLLVGPLRLDILSDFVSLAYMSIQPSQPPSLNLPQLCKLWGSSLSNSEKQFKHQLSTVTIRKLTIPNTNTCWLDKIWSQLGKHHKVICKVCISQIGCENMNWFDLNETWIQWWLLWLTVIFLILYK
jgi:hypothetical protein